LKSHRKTSGILIISLCLISFSFIKNDTFARDDAPKTVPKDVMNKIYEEVKTPYKYGIVIKPENGMLSDCPSVFSYNGRWYMIYIVFNKVGYETMLAESTDLLNWKPLGKILGQRENGWDSLQAAGYIALQNTQWEGQWNPEKYDGKYWMSYIGGSLKGYETDPLAIGIAWTDDPSKVSEWKRLDNNPVLHPYNSDSRWWETITLYKSNIIWDKEESLGFPFVMFYNAKACGAERIGMAVSNDMVNWKRYGNNPVINNHSGISEDPQIVKIGEIWVMFYFGAFWKPNAFDTFACSYDLVNWTKWDGTDLISPSEKWDKTYAHKPWVIKHNGIVYHYYCAVGNEGRVIALATSKNLK